MKEKTYNLKGLTIDEVLLINNMANNRLDKVRYININLDEKKEYIGQLERIKDTCLKAVLSVNEFKKKG